MIDPRSRRTLRDASPSRSVSAAIAERSIQRAIVRERAARVRECSAAWIRNTPAGGPSYD